MRKVSLFSLALMVHANRVPMPTAPQIKETIDKLFKSHKTPRAVHDAMVRIWGESDDPKIQAALAAMNAAAVADEMDAATRKRVHEEREGAIARMNRIHAEGSGRHIKPIFAPSFTKNSRRNALPPVGNDYDGSISEDVSAPFPSVNQVTTITLGGSTSTGDVTTLTVTPLTTAHGSPWSLGLGPVTIVFTTGATETLAAVAAGLVAAAKAAQTISSFASIETFQRIAEIVRLSSDGDVLTLTSSNRGTTFAYSFVTTGSVTQSSVTTGNTVEVLNVGTVAVRSGAEVSGKPVAGSPVAASTASQILGIVMDGAGTAPASAGAQFKHYRRGMRASIRRFGTASVYGEKACAADASVYVRKVAAAGEVSGAVTDTATITASQVITATPTPANTTLYAALIKVRDFFTGANVAEGQISMTSDGDATATEICDGLRTSLADDNDHLDAYVTGSGTDTLILTASPGYVLTILPTSPGVLAVVETTAAASDHMLWPGAKFIETTGQPGPQAVRLPRP